jgi:hypothetical protein
VLGKDVGFELAQRVTALPESELSRICSDLQAGEFIYEQPSLAGSQYTFKHALNPGCGLQLRAARKTQGFARARW